MREKKVIEIGKEKNKSCLRSNIFLKLDDFSFFYSSVYTNFFYKLYV